MPVDADKLYLIVGKVIIWGGTSIICGAILTVIFVITCAISLRIRSSINAKRYIRHWELIRAYIGRKNAEPVELQLIVKDALDTGAEAYEATRGDKSVKMQAAMQAWQSSLDRARKAAAPDHWLSSKVEVPEHPSNGSEFPIQRIEKPK